MGFLRMAFGPGMVWAYPFWAALLLWGLFPGSLTPKFYSDTLVLVGNDLLIPAIALFYLLTRPRQEPDSPNARLVSAAFLMLLAYCLVSVSWNGLEPYQGPSVLYTLVCTFFAFLLASRIVAGAGTGDLDRFLTGLCLVMLLITFVYSLEPVFGLRLKSDAYYQTRGDIVDRLGGPLYAASTGHFILLPLFAYCQDRAASSSRRKLAWTAMALAFATALLLTFSRAGMICLLLYAVLILTRVRKETALKALIVAGMLAASLFLATRQDSRLASMEDHTRTESYLTALQLKAEQGVASFLAGSGYGSYWQWYEQENQDTEDPFADEVYLVPTFYGRLLYHPHSLPLFLLLEIGLLGTAFLAALALAMSRLVRDAAEDRAARFLPLGVAATLPAFFLDFLLFINWPLSTLWWIMALSAFRLGHARASGTAAERVPAAPRSAEWLPTGRTE